MSGGPWWLRDCPPPSRGDALPVCDPAPPNSRSSSLVQVNSMLREQLEQANVANAALSEDIRKLTADWARARDELEQREVEWRREEEVWGDPDDWGGAGDVAGSGTKGGREKDVRQRDEGMRGGMQDHWEGYGAVVDVAWRRI